MREVIFRGRGLQYWDARTKRKFRQPCKVDDPQIVASLVSVFEQIPRVKEELDRPRP